MKIAAGEKNCGEDQIIRLKQVFKSDLKDAIF